MKYFTIRELTSSGTASRYGIDNTPGEKETKNLEALVDNILDPIREAWGAPIIVTSGYRSPKLNTKIGGSKTSQHMTGEAADIRTVSDSRADNKKLLDLILSLNLPFDQLINEYPDSTGGPDWIHISYKNGGKGRGQKLVCKAGKYTTF